MNINFKKIENYTTVFFLVSMMVIPRSYLFVKLAFLFLFIISFIIQLYRKQALIVNRNVFIFYGLIIFIGITWSLIGFLNGGTTSGILANFRLWVIWGICYSIVIIIFIQRNTLPLIHKAVVFSGILITIINFIGLYGTYLGLNFFPESFLNELDLRVGFHEGYVQITSQNIGSLFFIIPYLIAIQFRKDAIGLNNNFTKLSLFLCLLLAIFSGRRALWLTIIMTPIIIFCISLLLNNVHIIKKNYKRVIYAILIFGIIGFTIITQSEAFDIPTITHLKDAFSAEDERSIQKGFLIKGFCDYPIFGSGFGVGAGIVRNEDAAWLYELTYYQILFNFGIIGTGLILFVISSFLVIIFRRFKENIECNLVPFCILTGIASFALGAYSNPYFNSFDFLIYVSMIPYLASINLSQTINNN